MTEAMVTGRMDAERKEAGNAVLARAGLNASQAINLVYQRLIEDDSAEFLVDETPSPQDWVRARAFVDAMVLPFPAEDRFESLTRGEVKLLRAQSRGIL